MDYLIEHTITPEILYWFYEAHGHVSWYAPNVGLCGSKVYIQTNNWLCKYALWAFVLHLRARLSYSIKIRFNFNMKNVSRVTVILILHHVFVHSKCLVTWVLPIIPKTQNNYPRAQLKSIKLTQPQGWMPDTPGESKVSVLTQMFWKVRVICQTAHSHFTLLDVFWSTAIMNLKLLFFCLFLAVLLIPAEVCIHSVCYTAVV